MGHKTSVALENAFWDVLKEAADSQGISLAHLVCDVDATRKGNLSSELRVYALTWARTVRSPCLTPRRKRLLYISQYRGTQEMDLVLGTFAQAHVPSMTDEELSQFEEILAFPDQELYGFFFENLALPNPNLNVLADRIRETLLCRRQP